MKNSRNIIIFIAIAVVLVVLVVIFFSSEKKNYNWNPTFNTTKDEPYDLSLFRKTLEASYGSDHFEVVSNLEKDSAMVNSTNALLVYVNRNLYFDSLEVAALRTFTEKGNRVLFSADHPSVFLRNYFHDCLPAKDAPRKYTAYLRAKTARLSLKNSKSTTEFPVKYMVRDQNPRYPWQYFSLDDCEEKQVETEGSVHLIDREFTNFIRFSSGNGAFYVQTTPLVFTNYYFMKKEGFEFTSQLLDAIPHTNLLYYQPATLDMQPADSGPAISESPLRFILSNPPLKWAWYLIIALTVLYVLNTLRRRQKVIPVFSLPQNETANYLDVVSRMYRREGKHKHIVAIQEKLILRFLANKYRINLKINDSDSMEEAGRRLQMKPAEIRHFFNYLERAKNNSTLTDEEFIETINQIKDFYKRCP